MTPTAFLGNVATVLALMAAAAVIEVFLPLFERRESSKGTRQGESLAYGGDVGL